MHPANVSCITVAHIDCCVLANNHVLDYGHSGLLETIETLQRAGVQVAGAGPNRADAQAPAVIEVPGEGRVVVLGLGSETSGILRAWAATDTGPGVNLLEDLSDATVGRIGEMLQRVKRPGDIVVASIHWGGNWGYAVTKEHQPAFLPQLQYVEPMGSRSLHHRHRPAGRHAPGSDPGQARALRGALHVVQQEARESRWWRA